MKKSSHLPWSILWVPVISWWSTGSVEVHVHTQIIVVDTHTHARMHAHKHAHAHTHARMHTHARTHTRTHTSVVATLVRCEWISSQTTLQCHIHDYSTITRRMQQHKVYISWCVWCIQIHTTACAWPCTQSVLMEVGLDQRWVGSNASVLDDSPKHLISSSTCACHEWIKSQITQPLTASTHKISTIVHATTKLFSKH